MSKRVYLSVEQASAMLPDGDAVHVAAAKGNVLLVAEWDRQDVVELIKTGKPELSGPIATNMNYGIAASDKSGRLWFVETRPPK